MLCPKCKKEIDNNTLICTHCSAKVASSCKKCGTYNPITSTECSYCGEVLLQICSKCGSANLPKATHCRKCKESLQKEISIKQNNAPIYQGNFNSQQKIKTKLVEAIKNANTKIITISGESGIGKNLVIRTAINELKSAKVLWLQGNCTQISQLSPFGYFQDLLLTFFNINNFCPDTLQLKKDSLHFFKEDFPTLTNNEIFDLLNFLYPENLDYFENIYFNKVKIFSTLKKVFSTIFDKTKVVFIVDNFNYIDGLSFDFFKELFKDEIIQQKSKIIITTSEPNPGLGLLNLPCFKQDNYLDLTISPYTQKQIETFLKQYQDIIIDKELTNKIYKISKGNISIVEQIVLLEKEIRDLQLKNITYNSIEKVINLRLSILKQKDIKAFHLLMAMSILGKKFYPAIISNFDNISPTEYENSLENLVNTAFIHQLTNLSFEFKSSEIQKIIISQLKDDEKFDNVLNQLFEIINNYKHSSIALLAYITQKLNNNDQAFDVWTTLTKQAAYIGDIGLYIIAQKQSLKLIENKSNDFYQKVKKNIYTRVGKLLEPIDHNTSFEYIQNAIMMLDDNQDTEHIELLGYLASCSMKMGNYCGTIECIESVLSKLPEEMNFDKILIKSRLTKPLLKLGNYGQLINIVETELFPEIEKVLQKGRNTNQISLTELYELWLGIYFDLAEALVFQGDLRAFDVIQNIYEILDKNKTTDTNLVCRVNLLLALANTLKGEIKVSNKILSDILKEHTLNDMDVFIISRWNFIDILNKFFLKEYNTLHSELFNVAAYANNVNDNFTKNILKTILAKILKENNQTKKALEILEEQVSYFAKEKVATGVLLSWYLIAEIKLITNGTQFALDIATKALDIAQSSNINNYYFITLFNKLIGEIYLAKQDFESAKVYFEKAIFLSKQFDLQYFLVKIYIQCAKLYQELALPKTSARNEYIKQALKMFQFAKAVPCVENQPALQKHLKEELNILSSFCKLNGIILKKETK